MRPLLTFSKSLALVAVIASTNACGSTTTDPGQPVHVEPPAETPTSEVVSEDPDDPGEPDDAEDRSGDDELVVSEQPCDSDADCVPAGCCHAAACVAAINAPSCEDVMCTMECRYGTLDCGGECLCHEGRCAARLSDPPRMLPSR